MLTITNIRNYYTYYYKGFLFCHRWQPALRHITALLCIAFYYKQKLFKRFCIIHSWYYHICIIAMIPIFHFLNATIIVNAIYYQYHFRKTFSWYLLLFFKLLYSVTFQGPKLYSNETVFEVKDTLIKPLTLHRHVLCDKRSEADMAFCQGLTSQKRLGPLYNHWMLNMYNYTSPIR